MIPQMLLTKIATMVFQKVSERLSPVEDYVYKDNDLDMRVNKMEVELHGLHEQITLLKDLVIKYSGDR